MRVGFAASTLCLSALVCIFSMHAAKAVTPAATASATITGTATSTSAATSAATAPTPAAAVAPAAAGDAAAKHLKRTACLKEAKTKKLIGSEKTAFLKSCVEAPQEPISASRQIPTDRP